MTWVKARSGAMQQGDCVFQGLRAADRLAIGWQEIITTQLNPLRTGATFALSIATRCAAPLGGVWMTPGAGRALGIDRPDLEPLITNPPSSLLFRGLLLISTDVFIGMAYALMREWLPPAHAAGRA